ncbi:MAG: sulfatase, partial [Verrucomicrobiota bacterium]
MSPDSPFSLNPIAQRLNRRTFLQRSSLGLGVAAMHHLNQTWATSSNGIQAPNAPGVSGFPDLPVQAKRVIF